MHGIESPLGQILNQGNHYRIPGYQRNYQWTEPLWQGLVSDVMIATKGLDSGPKHWMGILLTSQSHSNINPGYSGQMEYLVIDGQQRLTTLLIWVVALLHHASDVGEPVEFDVEHLAKLTVQESDRKAFEVVLANTWRQNEHFGLLNHQIVKAYRYFRFILWLGQDAIAEEEQIKMPDFKNLDSEIKFEDQWQSYLEKKTGVSYPRGVSVSPSQLLRGTLQKLSVFSLIHNPTIDESQAEIFDTLNGKHQELEPLDHVRNSLFVRIEDVESTDLYRRFWYPAETALRKIGLKYMKPGKAFIYDYVISKGEKKRQKSINASRGASHFSYLVKNIKDSEIADYICHDLVPAMLTWQVVVRSEDKIVFNDVETKFSAEALQHMTNIRDLSVGPANPLVLHYATGFTRGKISDSNLVEALFMVENFLVRQVLAARAMSPLRARVMDIMGNIDGSFSLDNLKTQLTSSDWVSDEELLTSIHTTELYRTATPKALGAIFRGVERSLSGPGYMRFIIGTGLGSYTVEHIFPQKSEQWASDLQSWQVDADAMAKRLHSLGNLTVVTREHNSAVGNSSFEEKRKYPTVSGSFAPLSLNKGWLDSSLDVWGPSQIDKRAGDILSAALAYWRDLPTTSIV
jgi:uncharacterized protein with ParB-like and HNH nuclease domain